MRTKKFLIILTCILASTIIYVACEKQSYDDLAIKDAQKMVEQFNIGKLQDEQGSYLEGAVQITAVKDDGVYVKIILPNAEKSENFKLQMETVESYKKDIDKAQILYFRNTLIVNSLEEPLKLIFTIGGDNKVEAIEKMQFDTNYKGYGLAWYESSEIESRYVKPECKCYDIREHKTCDSGGPGATQCSVNNGGTQGSCSVTCEGTYYACCN